MIKGSFVLVTAVLVCMGCRPEKADTESLPDIREPTGVQEEAQSGPGPWDCEEDEDCINSCMMGAVNALWYEKNKKAECKDGCAAKSIGPPRCVDGGCAAFDRDGNPEEGCTKKQVPEATED